MGQNTGQTALTIVGGVVGGYLTGWSPAGIQAGASLGGLAGQALFPTHIRGPQLNDNHVTTSAAGTPIPILHGRPRPFAGSVIWTAKPVTIIEEEGGKGGPVIETETRLQSFTIGLCEGRNPDSDRALKVMRTWANNQLVYDRSRPIPEGTDQSTEEWQTYIAANAMSDEWEQWMTFYDGRDDQLPDPTEESYLGVGNVPAYRGHARAVFNNLPLKRFFEQMPNLTWELSDAIESEPELLQRRTDVLYSWGPRDDVLNLLTCGHARGPTPGRNEFEYNGNSGGGWTDDLEAALESASEQITSGGFPVTDGSNLEMIGWSLPTNQNEMDSGGLIATGDNAYELDPGESIELVLHYNRKDLLTYWDQKFHGTASGGGCDFHANLINPETGEEPFWLVGQKAVTWASGLPLATPHAGFYTTVCASEPYADGAVAVIGASCPGSCTGHGSGGVGLIVYADYIVNVRRKVKAPENPCIAGCWEYPLLPEDPNYCAIGSLIERNQGYTQTPVVLHSYRALQVYTTAGGSVTKFPLGPVLPAGDPDDTQANWEAAYAAALAAGAYTLVPGLVYGVDYPTDVSYAWVRSWENPALDAGSITVGEVVSAICERAGLAADEFDTSNLTERLGGYLQTQTASARDNITPLMSYSFFGAVENNGQIIFPLREQEPSFSITFDDLAAHPSGAEQPSVLRFTRTPDEELIKTARVHYHQQGLNTPGQQTYTWQLTSSVNVVDVNLPITMTENKAAQIAEVAVNETRTRRDVATFFCGGSRIDELIPGFVGLVDTGLASYTLILDERTYSPPGLIECKAYPHNIDDYASDAIGTKTVVYNDEPTLVGPTELLLIDSTALSASGNDAGVYVAARGFMSGWTGAEIVRSIDDGVSWQSVLTVTTAATIGTLTSDLPVGPVHTWDEASEVTVEMDSGTLSSSTDELVLNGANAVLVGGPGRWMVLQFVNATQDSDGTYTLSRLLQGRRGTEWAVGQILSGDRLILVNSALYRLPMDASLIGTTVLFKAVANGQTIASVEEQELVPTGAALECYSVDRLEGARDNTGGFVIFWQRRTRLSGEWRDGVDVPLNEEIEAYEVDVLDGDTVVATLSTSVQRATLTLADQVSLFGEIQATLDVAVYQMSAVVGRGYPAAETVEATTSYSADDPPLVLNTVQFSAPQFFVSRNNPVPRVLITATRSGDVSTECFVTFETAGGTATPGPTDGADGSGYDYGYANGIFGWLAGDGSTKGYYIRIYDDGGSGTQTFNLTMSSPSGTSLGAQSTAVVNITD